jgi:hypothetical protein
VLDYKIRENGKNGGSKPSEASDNNLPVYATKAELEAVLSRITAIQTQIDVMKGEKTE